jgi:Flp pilus assembly protein TadG
LSQPQDESGQALVEFALVLPLLLIVVTAIVQLGLTFNNYLDLTDAVRAGARVAAVSRSVPDPNTAAASAIRRAANGLTQQKLDVTVDSTWQPGADVTVTGKYPYTLTIFGIPVHSGSLTSSTTERVE